MAGSHLPAGALCGPEAGPKASPEERGQLKMAQNGSKSTCQSRTRTVHQKEGLSKSSRHGSAGAGEAHGDVLAAARQLPHAGPTVPFSC